MSIRDQLTNILGEYRKGQKSSRLEKKDLISIFGKNVEEKMFNDSEMYSYYHYILFEEEDTLYFAQVREDEDDGSYDLVSFAKTGHFYRKVNDRDLKMIIKEKEIAESKAALFDKVLTHKKFKLKKLFI